MSFSVFFFKFHVWAKLYTCQKSLTQLGPVEPSFRALSGRLKLTVRRIRSIKILSHAILSAGVWSSPTTLMASHVPPGTVPLPPKSVPRAASAGMAGVVKWLLWEGFRESRRCSRDTYPESYITEYTSVYEENSAHRHRTGAVAEECRVSGVGCGVWGVGCRV